MLSDATKNRKPLLISILFLAGAVFLFVGGILLYNRTEDNVAPCTPDQVTAKIIGELQYTDLAKVDPTLLPKHYNMSNGILTSCSVYMSKSSDSAAELSCFLLTDTSKYEKLQDAVAAHVSTKAAGLKSLNPTQYDLLKNYLIVRHGRYVLVAVGKDTDAENKVFQSVFN